MASSETVITWALTKPWGVLKWEIKEIPPSMSVSEPGFRAGHPQPHWCHRNTSVACDWLPTARGITASTFLLCSSPHQQAWGIRCIHQLHSSVPNSRVQCSKYLTASAHAMTCHPLCWGSESYRTILIAIQYITWRFTVKQHALFSHKQKSCQGKICSFNWCWLKLQSFLIWYYQQQAWNHTDQVVTSKCTPRFQHGVRQLRMFQLAEVWHHTSCTKTSLSAMHWKRVPAAMSTTTLFIKRKLCGLFLI